MFIINHKKSFISVQARKLTPVGQQAVNQKFDETFYRSKSDFGKHYKTLIIPKMVASSHAGNP